MEALTGRSMIARRHGPRLGFLGVGWIGRHRMGAIAESGHGRVAAVADPAPEVRQACAQVAPEAERVGSLDELLECGVDGIVIATPSALHAEQAVRALERGIPVFCQKPLGRTAAETERVVAAARAADVLLGVDLSYRHTEAMRRIGERVRSGELGEVFAADLVFHNAYGPDKPWFYDAALSGGGCVIDLGIHLVDLALWVLGSGGVRVISSRLYASGRPLPKPVAQVEDYAVATLEMESGAVVRLACSWNLSAGRDAVIEAAFWGTGGGAVMRNLNGSFYDFAAEACHGTARETLAAPPDAWGGRAAVDWAQRLADGACFDPSIERVVDVARVLDGIYGR